MACGPALLHRVPCCKHELQPALQPHRSICPEPRRPLGVLSSSQEGAVRHLTTRYRHTHMFLIDILLYLCDIYMLLYMYLLTPGESVGPPEGTRCIFCNLTAAGNPDVVILTPSHFFLSGCFSKDQVYLDGILRLLRHRTTIDFKMLSALGKVSAKGSNLNTDI